MLWNADDNNRIQESYEEFTPPGPVANEVLVPPTAARVFYAYTLKVNGHPVGTFQSFTPSSTRQIVRLRGIANNGGWPFEMVPAPADVQIAVNHIALYRRPLTAALGFPFGSNLDLNWMKVPFEIEEICNIPGSDALEQNTYVDCMLSNVNRTLNQTTAQVAETATIQVRFVKHNNLTDFYAVASKRPILLSI